MKDWQKEIVEGMKLIKEGCSQVKMWKDCKDCPFTRMCGQIWTHIGFESPEEWDIPNVDSTDS